MRLGKKKEKDKELEIRSVDGITRLICLSKGQAPLKGNTFDPLLTLSILFSLDILMRKSVDFENSKIENFKDFKEFCNNVKNDVQTSTTISGIFRLA